MAYDLVMANRVREALIDIKQVEERSMFGSLGFMVNGKLILCVRKADIMYKVGKDTADETTATAEAEPVIMRNRIMKDWVYVDNSKLNKPNEFNKWLKLALNINKQQN